jgi:hypothetical protein
LLLFPLVTEKQKKTIFRFLCQVVTALQFHK